MNKHYVLKTLEAAIKFKRVPDKEWLELLITELEADRITAVAAKHAFHRKAAIHTRDSLWEESEFQMLAGAEYLNVTGIPPCPKQTAIGLMAVRHARIMTFFGPSGTGKTTCAVRAATYSAMVQHGITLAAIGGMHLGRMSTGELSDFIEAACEADVVILDDIDKGSKSETRSSALLEILEYRERTEWCGPTIVTTNHVGQQLAEKIERQTEGYGLPIVNRLRRGITVNFGEGLPDWREVKRAMRLELAAKRPGDEDWQESLSTFGELNWRAL